MKIIFCEECGGRNSVRDELLAQIEIKPLRCQICGNIMSQETLVPHNVPDQAINTQHCHLLFIDDDVFHLQLMKKTLEKEYTVSIASTGIHGMELAAERQPDLILLDLNMPGMDGYEVCRRLKDNPVTRKIGVIFVSARDHEDDEYRGFTLGAVDYISKPINLQVLNARIMVQLRIKQLLEQQKRQADSMIQSLRQNSAQAESEQEELRRQNRGLLAVLDALPEKILIEDAARRIAWANRAALEFCGQTLAGLAGRSAQAVLKDEGIDSEAGQQQGRPGLLQFPLFDEDGGLDGTACVLSDEQGGPAQICQAAETAINSFIGRNRKAVRDSLNTILFGIDAISSILRDNKEFELVSRPVLKAAEELDRMICSLLDFHQRPDRDS